MVKCSRCGVEIADSFELCPNCGNDLKKDETTKNTDSEVQINESAEVSKTCPKCGSTFENGEEFCSECGQSLSPIKKSSKEDILSSIDFLTVIVKSDDESMNKAARKLGLRLVFAILLFFVPSITNAILDIFGLTSQSTCGLQQ